MLVLVKTDNHVDGGANLTAEVESVIVDSLSRFKDRITRVEVKFFDDNSRQKEGTNDIRCVMEARLAGLDPMIVSHEAANVHHATDGAVDKLKKMLDRTLGKLGNHKGRTSFGGDQVI